MWTYYLDTADEYGGHTAGPALYFVLILVGLVAVGALLEAIDDQIKRHGALRAIGMFAWEIGLLPAIWSAYKYVGWWSLCLVIPWGMVLGTFDSKKLPQKESPRTQSDTHDTGNDPKPADEPR